VTLATQELSLQVFESLQGEQFFVGNDAADEVRVLLSLTQAKRLSKGHSGRPEPFTLAFEGSASEPLQQGTYLFHHPDLGAHPIFIVPVSQNRSTRQYQAIFN